MPYGTPKHDTLLKLRPIPSDQKKPDGTLDLQPHEQRPRKAGDKLGIINVRKAANKHWEIRMAGFLTIGNQQVDRCFIYSDDWKGITDIFTACQAAERLTATQNLKVAPSKVFTILERDNAGNVLSLVLDVPYASQTDNRNNPGGSCNVTSMSIGLRFFGIKQRRSGQFEDELYEYMEDNGLLRHSPEDLKKLVEAYGLTDRFVPNASKEEIKKWLISGRPVVVHGYFTDFGHIVVIVGFDEDGWILHDPFGEYPYGDLKNSDTVMRGKYVHYSYGLMGNVCWSDGGCWTHFLDRAGYSVPTTPQTQPKGMTTLSATGEAVPDGCSIIKANRATLLKAKPVFSGQLKPGEKTAIDEGEEIVCVVSQAEAGHLLLTKPGDEPIEGRATWYAFAKHIDVITPGGAAPTLPGAILSKGDIQKLAGSIGVEPRALAAVIAVEASGAGFLPSARPKILYEAHIFSELTNSAFDDSHPRLSSYSWNRDLYAGGEEEWPRLEAAMKLDREAALMSCSWGMGQVLGRNWQDLGYKSIDEFVQLNSRSEADQVECMIRFIKVNGILDSLKQKRWGAFARVYNGPAYEVNEYDVRLQEAYDKLP